MATLDVEDEDHRHDRLYRTFRKLNSESASNAAQSSGPVLFDTGDRSTCYSPPNNELIARVMDFLPQMEAANDALTMADPKEIDLEQLKGDEPRYIEMNLGLGVFTDNSQRDAGADDRDMDTQYSSCSSDEDEEGFYSSDSDSEVDIITQFSAAQKAQRAVRPLPKRARLSIEVVGETKSSSEGMDMAS